MKVAIALGGGGARALGNLGAMTVLTQKYSVQAISGTSMGAIIAAYYGVHGETESLREWFEEFKPMDFFMHSAAPTKHSLIGTTKLRKLFEKWYGDVCLEELSLPVRLVATNLNTREEHVFREGKIVDCVLASIAIPGIFPAVEINGEFFVDGGITNPTPLSALSRYKRVIGIDFAVRDQHLTKTPTALEAIMHSYEVARRLAVKGQVKGKKYHLIQPAAYPGVQVLRFDKAKEHITLGERAAQKFLEKSALA